MRTSDNNHSPKLHYKRTPILVFILLTALVLFSFTSHAYATESCIPTMAHVVSVQGTVELRRADQTNWRPVAMNSQLCAGDMIRARSHSRAALRLNNESMLRLDQKTTITFPKIQTNQSTSLLDLLNGAIHVITRTPMPFRIRTPYVSAAVDGTEFFVGIDGNSTRLVVYEGQVTASNDQGSLSLIDNEAAITFKDQAPQKDAIVRPTDAVQWALHYPTIIDDLLDPPSQDKQSASFLIHQAGQLLIVGRVDEATINIEQALTFEPDNSDAYALQAIIAVVQNDKYQALSFATQAVELDPTSATAKLALSYAQQAHFDIEDALATVHEAVKLDSQNALAWARLAELQMSTGYLDRALDAAQQAVRLNPDIAKTRTVLGFAYLLQINTEDAKTVFAEAIQLDQADPMPRLGMGLALIREGALEAGRVELEIAASLDPANSLIRSYLGKAYFEERRYSLASTQFDLAKERDPHDPTPWFYDAIQKQTQNQPVEALRDIQKSIELNDNRAVYRSKLLLDQDEASRGSSLARIFDNLGFEKRARVETAKSLSVDPANHSAHRFLSDSYINAPRHEIARVSELLQAQLLQPINVNPVQPHLAVADLNIITGTSPSSSGFNEFSPLMERNKPQLVASGIVGSNSTVGNEVVASALYDRASISVGQFHHETNGFRTNNDQTHNIYNAFMQYAVTPKFNVQAEVRKRDTKHGDLLLDFDPKSFSRNNRRKLKEDVARFGARYAYSPNQDFLVSASYLNRNEELNFFQSRQDIASHIKGEGFQVEAQHLLRGNRFNITSGANIYRINVDNLRQIDFTKRDGVACGANRVCDPLLPGFNRERNSGYIYANLNMIENFNWTLGLSYDSFKEFRGFEFDTVNPKIGLQVDVNNYVRLRAAWFETVKSALVANQTLEPTQVAGFNQFFDDLNGTRSQRKGIGLDIVDKTNTVFGGVEYSERELNVPSFSGPGAATRPISPNVYTLSRTHQQHEKLFRSYLYWLPIASLVIRGELQYEQFSREANIQNNPDKIKTLSAPLSISYFHPSGLFARSAVTFVSQNLNRPVTGIEGFDAIQQLNSGTSDFFLLDTALSYRFPNRRGLISLEGKNLLDKQFYYRNVNFQVSEAINPRFIPTRTFFVRLTLNF